MSWLLLKERYRILATVFIPGAMLWLASGCASHAARAMAIRESFYANNLPVALEEIDRHKDRRLRNNDVKQLDRAIIELAQGDPQSAERLLRTVRDRFDHYEQVSLADEVGNLLADSNARAYAGEDYEKVLIRTFLALSSLMHGGEDAGAYALQTIEKQQQIIDRIKSRDEEQEAEILAYKQVAIGPYIRAMLAEESPLTLDEAAQARIQVANWAPDFRDAKSDLQRAQFESPHRPGEGTLYLFAMVGRGPIKEEVAEIATQASLLIADRIISNNSNRGLPPTLAPVKVPKVRTFTPSIQAVELVVDGQHSAETATLLDIGEMAQRQAEAHFPRVIAEAVARRVIKKGVIYAAKEGVDASPWSAASVGLSALGVAWEATETADTRCWSLLPDQIQVARVSLPVGEHEVQLRGVRGHLKYPGSSARKVTIRQGRHTYLMGFFPDEQLVGQLIISEGPDSRSGESSNLMVNP